MTSRSDRPRWYDAILPVIDLRHGQVVRGIAGRRDEYRPIVSRYVVDSRPGSIAQVYKETFGFQDCYVAELNAICDAQLDVAGLEGIAVQGLNLWLDTGIGNVRDWRKHDRLMHEWHPYRWVVGLESLENWQSLKDLLDAIGPQRLVFSLDLKEGCPLTSRADFKGMPPREIAVRAAELGVRSMIVLDLAAVGEGKGSSTEGLLKDLVRQLPDVELLAGGGMSWPEDIEAMVKHGARRVLVASALHDGRIAPQYG